MDCLKNLKAVYIVEKQGGRYLLGLKTKNRDSRYYYYENNPGAIEKERFVEKENNKKCLSVSPEAEEKILSAVSAFNSFVAGTEDGTYTSFEGLPGNNKKITVRYKRTSATEYEYVIFLKDDSGKTVIRINTGCNAETFIRELNNEAELSSFDENTINIHPLYMSAVIHNDCILLNEIKVYYKVASPEECTELSSLTGRRILCSLPDEFNKDYTVDASTIDNRILQDSGYTILHRPYFSMKDATHSIWSLNPHTKYGVDASQKDAGSITFEEYLRLF